MRKLMLGCLLGTAAFSAQAQSDSAFASVHYTLKHISDTTWRENPQVTNYILYLGKDLTLHAVSRESPPGTGGRTGTTLTIVASDVVSVGNVPAGSGTNAVQMEKLNSIGSIYKNVKDAKLITMEYTNGQLFAVEDKMPEISWSIQSETKEIMGLQCQKAVGDFKGRTYEAWFCSQLPYSNGPWKLSGLPGLIIEASDTKKEVVFSFVSFENLENKKPIALSSQANKTTPKAFKQYKEALEKDRQAMAGTAATNTAGGMVFRGVLATNPDGTPMRFRQMNNPIELEKK